MRTRVPSFERRLIGSTPVGRAWSALGKPPTRDVRPDLPPQSSSARYSAAVVSASASVFFSPPGIRAAIQRHST